MTNELKLQIANGVLAYAQANGLTNNDIARETGVNSGYLSNILRLSFTNEVGGKAVPIGDKHFYKLAAYANISVKKEYWKTVQTRQMMQAITALTDAKQHSRTAMIIQSTGMGKTKAADILCNKTPLHTYRLTVSSLYRLNDILAELADKLGVDFNNGYKLSQKTKVDLLAERLKTIYHNGGKPMIIFDEAENLKMPVINMLKGLYDVVNNYCAIVLIGTETLLVKLTHTRRNSVDAVPQFYRRFKVGLKRLSMLEKHIDFKPFFEAFGVDKGLQKLLISLCDNYGELHDYLEPALKEADERGELLTEDFFRLLYDIPKY